MKVWKNRLKIIILLLSPSSLGKGDTRNFDHLRRKKTAKEKKIITIED
jgi:hypothetical protein